MSTETSKEQKKTKGWLGRSLENYKEMHKAKHPEVMKAKTLTEARKICFGVKTKKRHNQDTNTRG